MEFRKKSNLSPREIAFLAIDEASSDKRFLSDFFEEVREKQVLNEKDFRLAQEIAFGVIKQALSLDFFAKQLSKNDRLPAKRKEKILLRMSLYQLYFMDKIPFYAIASEMNKLCKKMGKKAFLPFLTAILKKAENTKCALPSGNSLEELSITYSIPQELLKQLLGNYSLEETKNILKAFNEPPMIMVRIRPEASEQTRSLLKEAKQDPSLPEMFAISSSLIRSLSQNKDVYFQNAAQVFLIKELAKTTDTPKRILDVCSAPGGKLLLVHDLFPEAILVANDYSLPRIKRLKENIDKYHLKAHVTNQDAKLYESDQLFDLIIIDAPCSNTGVLNRRPEAKWRFTLEGLKALIKDQFAMIKKAASLLTKKGKIWYLTCSILPDENEEMVKKVCMQLDLSLANEQYLVLPNISGWDGGFACCFKKREDL